MPKSKQYVESSDDSSGSEPKTKKSASKKPKRDESSEDEPKPVKKSKKETKKEPSKESSDGVWELGNNRQVTVREFKGKLLVDIREMYYDKEGDLKPGKKGICMNMTQWRKFMDIVSDVDEAVKAKC